MNWLIQTLGSSVGKKLMMAISGIVFLLFLCAHLIGNLTIYGGGDAFNAYAERLHSMGALLAVFNLGLIIFAVIHISTGLVLFVQNLKARPARYHMDRPAGGRTWSSKTMPYTGILILCFVIFHLANFTFVNKSGTTIYEIVSSAFASPLYVAIYIVAVIVVALHVRHGLWSAFQTIGANHPKYMPAVMTASVVFGLIVGMGFGVLPIYILAIS
jgi:succinate dehydrogenase / fumarate reductase cytochrome b subunit